MSARLAAPERRAPWLPGVPWPWRGLALVLLALDGLALLARLAIYFDYARALLGFPYDYDQGEGFELYDTVQLATEDGSLDIRLIVVGAVADNTNLLYVIDPRTGEILQLDLDEQDVQPVNSNFRTFVEFLYRFALFAEADEGKAGRAERAAALRAELERIDPPAFGPDGWWPLVISQLK